jgi:tetratricopeptide (TPR) repeat protein
MTSRFSMACILTLNFGLGTVLLHASVQDDLAQARTLRDHGRYTEEIEILKSVTQAPDNSGDRDDIASAWNMLGAAYLGVEDYNDAEKAIRSALQISKRSPANLRGEAVALDGLSYLYMNLDDSARELKTREEALHLYERIEDHAGIFFEDNSQANLAIKTMDLKQAHHFLDDAFAQLPLIPHIEPGDVAQFYSNSGWLAYTERKSDLALSSYEKALGLWTQGNGLRYYKTAETYVLLGKVYLFRNDPDTATTNIRKGLLVLEQTLGDKNPVTLSAELVYATALDAHGQHTQAESIRASAEHFLHGRFGIACRECAANPS